MVNGIPNLIKRIDEIKLAYSSKIVIKTFNIEMNNFQICKFVICLIEPDDEVESGIPTEY